MCKPDIPIREEKIATDRHQRSFQATVNGPKSAHNEEKAIIPAHPTDMGALGHLPNHHCLSGGQPAILGSGRLTEEHSHGEWPVREP